MSGQDSALLLIVAFLMGGLTITAFMLGAGIQESKWTRGQGHIAFLTGFVGLFSLPVINLVAALHHHFLTIGTTGLYLLAVGTAYLVCHKQQVPFIQCCIRKAPWLVSPLIKLSGPYSEQETQKIALEVIPHKRARRWGRGLDIFTHSSLQPGGQAILAHPDLLDVERVWEHLIQNSQRSAVQTLQKWLKTSKGQKALSQLSRHQIRPLLAHTYPTEHRRQWRATVVRALGYTSEKEDGKRK